MLFKRVLKMIKAREGPSSKGKEKRRRNKEMKRGGSSIRCFECGKKGHIKPECPSLNNNKSKKGFSVNWDENEDSNCSSQ